MKGYLGPIPIPLVSEFITKAITDFGESKHCQAEAWYHDEPIWFVREEAESNFFRQVQVAAFLTENGEEVFFTAFAYIAGAGNVRITPSDRTKSLSVRLAKLLIREPGDVVQSIKDYLGTAWEFTKQLNRADAVS